MVTSSKSSPPLFASEVKAKPANPALGRAVFQAAGRSAEFFDHLRVHYREARRTEVRIECSIKLRMKNGDAHDTGTATILNVSPSGALLGEIKLGKKCFPVGPFLIDIVLNGCDYEGIGIEAKPVRFDAETGGIGVKFEEIFVTV